MEVPKHWVLFKDEVDNWIDNLNALVDIEEERRVKERKEMSWHQRLFYKHGAPGSFHWNMSLVEYGLSQMPKYTEGTIEEYYDWCIERGLTK